MATIKTGLMYSPLTERVFWGQMNTKTGVRVGREPKDVTSDFIGVMLQKFPINTRQTISANGETECIVIVLDEEKSKKFLAASDLHDALQAMVDDYDRWLLIDGNHPDETVEPLYKSARAALAKARGEQ